MARKKFLPSYFKWRDGHPRWEPGPGLRKAGFVGRDFKDDAGRWLGLEAAIDAAKALNAELAGNRTPRKRVSRAPTRTGRHLFELWTATPEFELLGAATQADYKRKAEIWLEEFGAEPVAAIGPKVLIGYWRIAYRARGHHMANGILAVARIMLTFARKEEWIATNPAFALQLKQPQPRVAFWAADKVAAFVTAADSMPDDDTGIDYRSIGDAVVIALHSAQRQSDVLALPNRIFTEQRVLISQFKTGALIDADMTPPLRARIAAIRARWRAAGVAVRETVVSDERTGQRWDEHAFRKAFRAVRAEACRRAEQADETRLLEASRFQPGLAELRFQDLRDTAVTRLAMAGCTLAQISAISGHKPDHIASVIKHYLALNEAIADAAVGKLTSWLEQQGIAL